MSASSVLLVLVCLALLLLLPLLVALLSPIVVTVDSAVGQVRLSWLAFVECLVPLPGKGGKARVFVTGRLASPIIRKPPALPERPGKAPGTGARGAWGGPGRKRKSSRSRNLVPRLLRRCLADSVIRGTLARQLARLWKEVWRSFVLTRWKASLSLPDPAVNGMLVGFLAQAGPPLNSRFGVNFIDENSFFLEGRVYPYRLLKAAFVFMTGLPYISLLRAWRTSSSQDSALTV